MAQVKVRGEEIRTSLAGDEIRVPFVFTVTGITAWDPKEYTIADATEQTVWGPAGDASEPGSTFKYVRIIPDQDIYVLLVTDVGNEIGNVFHTQKVLKDTLMILTSNVSYALPTDNSFTGTLDVIDQIRVRNDSGETVHVDVLVGT